MAFPAIPIISFLGTVINGFFGLKKSNTDAAGAALKVLGDIDASQGQREQAIATVLAAEASSESWLTNSWRPLTMLTFLAMLLSFWFGYTPPQISGPMPPILAEIFVLLKLGIGGYIGGRTIEKIIDKINIGSVLKRYIEKQGL